MPIKNMLDLSVRIFPEGENKNLGSGILYVDKSKRAFVFTAAHLIEDAETETLSIELFNELIKSKKQDYVLHVNKSDFVIHALYEVYKTTGEAVNVNDIAGIEIQWKEWMCDLNSFYLSFAPESAEISFIGYPANACESGMKFSYIENSGTVKSTSDKRIQITSSSPTTKADNLEGMSGSGMFVQVNNDALCLSGLLTCTQGTDGSNGILNGVSGLVIKELCIQKSWPVPLFTQILKKVENNSRSYFADVPDCKMMIQSEPVDPPESQNNNPDLQQRKNQIKESIDNLQIMTAIRQCNELYACEEDSARSFALIHKAYCLMMIGKNKDACILLKDACDFPLYDQGLAYLMLSDLAQNQGQGYYVKHFLTLAEQSSGEAFQVFFYKRYIEMIDSDSHYSDDDFNELFSLIRTSNTTQREKHQIYQLLANISVIKYQNYENAITFLKNCFSLRGDKSLYLAIARCYASKALTSSKAPNLIDADYAYQYFCLYLNAADHLLIDSFYRNYGLLLCDIITCLGDAKAMYMHIDNIIAGCQDEKVINKLYLNKVQAMYSIRGLCTEEMIQSLPEDMRNPLLLRFEVQNIMDGLRLFLDEKCVYEYEKEKHGICDMSKEERLSQAETGFIDCQKNLCSKIVSLLQSEPGMDIFFKCSLSRDLLALYLNTHQGKEYNSFLDECYSLYPMIPEFRDMEPYRDEANGNPDNTEHIILRKMDEDGSPQSVKDVQNFYFRNYKYEKLISFYKMHLEEDYEAASFRRDEIIAQYIDALLLCSYLHSFAKEEYEKYKGQIEDYSIRDMLESKLDNSKIESDCYPLSPNNEQ